MFGMKKAGKEDVSQRDRSREANVFSVEPLEDRALLSAVLVNDGAPAALQTLQATNTDLALTQSSISTGMPIATATDDAETFVDTQPETTVSTEMFAFNDAATSALQALEQDNASSSLTQPAISTGLRIGTAADDAAAFMVNDSAYSALEALRDINADPSLTQPAISTGQRIASAADQATAIPVGSALDIKLNGLATLDQSMKLVESRDLATAESIDLLSIEVAKQSLTDTTMTEASAILQATQVQLQQQLATQALATANAEPQNLLSLFR